MTNTTNTAATIDYLLTAPRTAAFILGHDVRRNRGIVSKAIRSVITRAELSTRGMDYSSADSCGAMSGDPVYRVDLTDAECAAVSAEIARLDGSADCYHD